MSKFLSRKFVMVVFIVSLSVGVPIAFKLLDISEAVTISVLGVITAGGVSYGVLNYKESKLNKGE